MKTRTLLLLALGCGLAIMLAGAVFLFQLASQSEVAPPVSFGEPAQVGDMTIVVDDSVEADGELVVSIRIGGVVDAEGSAAFRLIASGRAVAVDLSGGGDTCGPTAEVESACTIRFDTSQADGDSRVLFYERGDEQARWVLS